MFRRLFIMYTGVLLMLRTLSFGWLAALGNLSQPPAVYALTGIQLMAAMYGLRHALHRSTGRRSCALTLGAIFMTVMLNIFCISMLSPVAVPLAGYGFVGTVLDLVIVLVLAAMLLHSGPAPLAAIEQGEGASA